MNSLHAGQACQKPREYAVNHGDHRWAGDCCDVVNIEHIEFDKYLYWQSRNPKDYPEEPNVIFHRYCKFVTLTNLLSLAAAGVGKMTTSGDKLSVSVTRYDQLRYLGQPGHPLLAWFNCNLSMDE